MVMQPATVGQLDGLFILCISTLNAALTGTLSMLAHIQMYMVVHGCT